MSIEVPSGYSPTRDFFGTVTEQGPLDLVTLSLPWVVLTDLVVAPDPERKSEYNRPLTVPHAKRFGQYLDKTDDPFTPPVALFTDPEYVELESLGNSTLDMYGLKLVKLQRDARIFILDGQHRIFGVMGLTEQYDAKFRKLKDLRSKAERNGQDREVLVALDQQLEQIRDKRDRLARAQVTAQILLTSRGTQAKRIFADVADNAKGISQSQRADFSDRNVFNRVARNISLATLDGLVDHVHDRLSKKNNKWLSLKDVVNVAQVMALELGQRWTIKREGHLKPKQAVIEAMTRDFFEGLIEQHEELQQLKAATIGGQDLRTGGSKVSLLGSATMIRALAAAYGRLRRGNDHKDPNQRRSTMTHTEIFETWSSALPPMTAGHEPHESGDPDKAQPLIDQRWLDAGTFQYPYIAPMARMGDLRRLTSHIVSKTTTSADE